jgi:hypothetical protein
MDDGDARSIPELLSGLVTESADLIRKEIQVIRTEFSEKLSQAMSSVLWLALGSALLLGAFAVLLETIVRFLSRHMNPLLAGLIVVAGAALFGLLLVGVGIRQLQPSQLAPKRTIREAQKDVELLKGSNP